MNELEKLYNVLIEKGLYTKSFQEFQQRYSQDEEYKNKVYNVVSNKGLYTKDRNSFFQKYSGVAQSLEDLKVDYKEPKKKVATASSARVGSSASARIPRFEPEGIEEDVAVRSDATVVRKPRIIQAQEVGKPMVEKPVEEKQEVAVSMEGMPQMSEFEYEAGKPLPEQILSVSPDQRKIELETNPFISFGKKLWETISLQTPSALQAKGAQGISNLVESDMRLLKSIADVPDDEIIEMPSLTDPRAGRKTKYKAGEYKRLITEKIARGNKATGAALDLAIKLNKDLENSDVISSLTQVKDGYDLVNFISSSIGQTIGQVPASVATGGSLSYAMESGNIYLETVKQIAEKEGITPLQVIQQGKDQVALAEIGGAISGALEYFGAKKVLDMFGLENIKKDLRKKAVKLLVNSQIEGATETGQEVVSKAATGLGAEGQLRGVTLTEALDAYAAGMFGAAGVQLPSLLGGSKKKTETKKEEEKTEFAPGETVTLDTKNKTTKVEPAEEILQPVILDYGDSKFGFIRDESGNMELTKELDTEEQATSMAEMLGKTYKKLDFTIQEVDSTDPYTPTKYKIIAKEKAPDQAEVSYTIDGSKMDRARFVAAVGEAKTEDALNELDTTDPDVQKIIDAKRAEITGETQVEEQPEGVTKENIKEKIAENNNKSVELRNKQKSELEELNKRENKNYADAFDILNVNEYSQDQTPRSQEAIDLANRHEKEFNDLLQEKRNIESDAEKLNFSNYNLTDTNKLDRLRGAINSVYETNRGALDEGFEVSVNALEEANSVGASDYVAHGMGKTSLANAYNDLINLFSKGINPVRGRGSLDVAPLSGGVSTGTTASGNAYMDGPFTLVANRNHSGPITNIDQVGGIIVNEGIATDEVLTSLRDLFPNLAIESTSNTKKLVEQLNSKKEEVVAEAQPAAINVADQYTSDEVNRVKSLPLDNEDGATMNLDGTKYEKGGLVIPLASRNLSLEELTPEKINEFVNENSESIGSDLVKVGIYKFPGRAEASIDINIVADKSKREEALQIARELGQESIFDLDTFENIKTGATGKNPKVLTPKEFLAIQERLSAKPTVTITPETSSNYANMTEDNKGNFVFFHVGDKGYKTIKTGTGKAPITSREEASALSKVGGLAMYYTGQEQTERQSAQGAKYAVKVPKEKVYDFNTDPLNLLDEARKRHDSENPGKAFDLNTQVAYVTKIAGERGFDMVVADWAGGTRAQTTKELTPVDVEESTGNVIDKKFKGKYKSNKEKGFKSVVPARKADKLQKVYDKINEARNTEKRYDDLYRLHTDSNKYTQQEITDLINNSDLSQELKDEYNTALESKEETRRSEVPAKKAKARLSSGVEQKDTRTQEEEIVREMDKLAEQSPEEAAFEEVQDAGKKDIGEAVAQNPTPNKKSFIKKALEFLGLSSENQLYRKIEDFANMPMMIGISDTLGSGVFKDALGNPMNVDGGLLFNLFRNPTLAWANVDKKYAENLVKQAKQVYTSNKELYDRLWKEGALPEGHIPYAIVRMGDDALYSNEAIFRYLSPWVKTLPLENRQAALEVLKKELETSAKDQTGISWIFELQDNIENGSIENFNGLLSYIKNLKENAKTETAISSITSLENQIKKLRGDEAFSDGIQIISEILDKKAPIAVLNFIEKNNITTVDELFDAIAEDAVKRAKADPNNKSDLSLPLRAFISTKIFSTEPLTTGKPSSNFSKALLGKTENPLWADVDKLTLPYIKDQISEPAMIAARPGDIVAIMGIDVREESAGVAKANHNNYGFGPKGKLIGYLKEPARAFDVFAELKAKAPRLFKPNKSGVYPSPESVIRQAGGVAYVDVPFRGARLLTGGVTNLDLIIGKLRTAFPEVGVFTTEQEFDEFLKQEGIRSRKDQNGNIIYGITKDGKVFLNPDNKSLRTPIHEFAHIWVDYLRSKASGNRGKDLLNKGLQLVDGTPEYTEAIEKYGERDLALEEALVELIATKGDTIINASQKSKFKNWLNALFKYIKEKFVSTKRLFDTKKTGDVEFKKFIENMTIDDFMNISLADLFGMTIVSRKFKPSEASTSAKARMSLGKLPSMVNEEINKIISEQKALGKKPVEVAREAAKYLKNTEAYKKLGDREKAKALDGVKRLSGMRVSVTTDEYAALKDQIKLEAKAARESAIDYKKSISNLVSYVRSLVKDGKISTFKAGVIIGRIANTNLSSPESVNKTISYVADVFDSANLAMKISRAKSLVKNAKRNIKSKIGQSPDLFTAAKVLLSIDPHFIPTPLIDDYLNIMEVIGERARVLSIKDAGEMAAKMNVIINAVINESETGITSAEETKVKATPEESAQEAESLIRQIESETLNTSKVLDKNANAVARKVASINRKDMTELLSTDKDGVVDYSKLKLLLGIRDNIKSGIVTNEALNLVTTVEQNRGVDTFSKILPKINGASLLNGVTRALGEVKSLISNKSGVLQAIRSTGTPNVDDVLGNFNDTTIYKLTFGKLASAKGKLDATLSDRSAKASAAEILFQNGIGFGPLRGTTRTNNDVVKAKYKVQTLLLQKEFESNTGSEAVSPAIDFINATIKAVTRKESSLTKQDAKILREIKAEFGAKDVDGNETLNFKKMEDSLTANDKKAMKLIEEINASTAEEALFTSAVIRGNRVGIINNYVHHAVSGESIMQQAANLVNRLLGRGPDGKPSTKAGTLNERTPGAKAIIFDPVFSSMKGARETLTDFYMTPVIREVDGMLKKLKDKVFEDTNSTEAQRDSVQAVLDSVNEALEITFQNHFSEDTFGEALIKGIQKLGYQSMLASLPRAGAEYLSNMSYAVLSDPVTMAQSVGLYDFAYSSDMLGFLENIGSSESTRLAGNEMLTSKYAEGGFASGYGRTSKSGASSKVMNYASFIADMTAGNVFRVNDVTADLVVSTPDKAISKPYYAQFFVNKFKELTGVELSKSELRKIANGTSEYLSPKYEDAIQKSREDADLAIIRMAGSTNSFNTILKNVPRKTDAPWTSAYRAINSLMARFYLTEYGTLRSAIIALFKTGQISRGAAVGLIAASVTRMSMYLVAFGLLKQLFDSAIAGLFDLEEPEEEEEDLMTTIKRSIVGSGVNALTRRTLGNIPYIPIAFGVEYLNEGIGEDYGLRDGEYDPFKNSLVFSKITTQDFYEKNPYEIFGKIVAGPFSPMVSTAFRAVTLGVRATKEGSKPETKKRAMDELEQRMTMEAIGNSGLIPFYKDARRIMMNDFYARNYDKKEDSSFTITEKQIDLVRKSNPAAARRMRAFKEQQKKIEARRRAIKKKFEKKQTKSN